MATQETESAGKSSQGSVRHQANERGANQVRLKVNLILKGTWVACGTCLEADRVPRRLLKERFVERVDRIESKKRESIFAGPSSEEQ
jgi:hypothetical protein